MIVGRRGRVRMTLVQALKAGSWEAETMAHLLDEDLLPPDCPIGGASAQHVWDGLRDLQHAYQEREQSWRRIPHEFEYLAHGLRAVVLVGA